MNISCIFLIIKGICFFASLIMIALLLFKVVKSNKDTKDGMGTIEQRQKNGHYKIAKQQIPKNLFIEFIMIIVIVSFFMIIDFDFKPILNILETNNIKLKDLVELLVDIFIILNSFLFLYQTKEAEKLLIYDEFYEQYRIISTGDSKKYNYKKIYIALDNDKRYLDYLLDCANKDYDMMKFSSSIPIISLIVDIVAKYFDITIINTTIFTVVIVGMIFLYISIVFIINRRIKKIKFNMLRNENCRGKIENMEKENLMKNKK